MSQTLSKGDRFRVIENGLTGVVNGVSFNSVQQEWEYYVTWDAFKNKGEVCYMMDDVKDLWQKIDDIKANMRLDEDGAPGYVNQDPDFLPPGMYGSLPGENKSTSERFKNEYLGEFKKECQHKWVEVGFTHTKTVCYHCDKEK